MAIIYTVADLGARENKCLVQMLKKLNIPNYEIVCAPKEFMFIEIHVSQTYVDPSQPEKVCLSYSFTSNGVSSSMLPFGTLPTTLNYPPSAKYMKKFSKGIFNTCKNFCYSYNAYLHSIYFKVAIHKITHRIILVSFPHIEEFEVYYHGTIINGTEMLQLATDILNLQQSGMFPDSFQHFTPNYKRTELLVRSEKEDDSEK